MRGGNEGDTHGMELLYLEALIVLMKFGKVLRASYTDVHTGTTRKYF